MKTTLLGVGAERAAQGETHFKYDYRQCNTLGGKMGGLTLRATGIVRKMDPLGRLVIPMEIRRTHQIADGDPIEIFVDGDRIILKKYAPGCQLCDNVNNLITVRGKQICSSCVSEILETRGAPV